ncbi:xaa-Pro aminopeptidase 1 isoform X1 [Nematostella vectensis]|uniref:xaa-Pro aminopeptidase 1 isoform X1 n=1 Tax=Nematostella vectensis TaxID=45351 RepID=UPI00138FADF9|nr:xaa-Pro aminopeptidase 1 isoform X1 [Nematostella vectensis]
MSRPTGHLLQQLRALMKNKNYVSEAIQAYIIPSCDAHQSEYLASCDLRRGFISGFDGSAGTAIVTDHKAALWTDGRYFLHAERQLDANWMLMRDGLPDTPKQEEWLIQELPIGSRVGVDPFLMPLVQWKKMSTTLRSAGLTLVHTETNLVDIVWEKHDRPCPPSDGVMPLGLSYTGKSWQDKVKELRTTLKKKKATAFVLTALDDVAWMFNLRGSDIEFNPVFFAYAIVTLDNVFLFIDQNKIDSSVRKHLELDNSDSNETRITLKEYNEIQDALREEVAKGSRIWISSNSSMALTSLVPETCMLDESSPVALSKALKNEVELEGLRQSHIRDAVALCEFFAWLEQEVPKAELTEILAADKLEELRREQDDFVSLSFATISSSGSNGAIIHYRPTEETTRMISKNDLYLCDSGAQYKDGTTDVTRTVHFGKPTRYEQECFTRVFKGHVSLAMTVFPNKTTGHRLEVLARKALWDVGLDYLHGTGHGVGCFLNVHEGPQGINLRARPDEAPLEAGMTTSIEPGYYEDGNFGIRIENVYIIKPVELQYNFKNKGWLGFEHCTLFPIQTKMLIPSMLSQEEVDWLNSYHELCAEKVGAALREQGRHEALSWLLKETRPLG